MFSVFGSAAAATKSQLWELRSMLVRGLGKINASQTAQPAQLDPTSSTPHNTVTDESTKRINKALQVIEAVLSHLTVTSAGDDNVCEDERGDSNIWLWLRSTQIACESSNTETVQTSSATDIEPTGNFWNTNASFILSPEPLRDKIHALESSGGTDQHLADDDDSLGPWDSISMHDVDLDHQSALSGFSHLVLHGSSGDYSATLFHSGSLEGVFKHPVASSLPTKLVAVGQNSPTAADLFAARPHILAGF